MNSKPVVESGLYRHFKGNSYRVHFTAKHSETEEPMVCYERIDTGEKWVRDAKMFTENVKRGDYDGPRFVKV